MKEGYMNSIKKIIYEHRVWIFFIQTIVIGWGSWFFWGEFIIAAPLIAAITTSFATEGVLGVKRIIVRYVRNFSLIWCLVAILLPFILAFVSVGVYGLIGGTIPELFLLRNNPLVVLKIAAYFMIPWASSAFLEEVGFRGYVLSELQEKYSPLISTVILGIFFGAWLLPEFLNPESAQYAMGGLSYYPWFILIELSFSVFMTWIYNKTNGNALISGYVFHGAMNVSTLVVLTNVRQLGTGFPVFDTKLFILSSVVTAIFAMILIIKTKGRLGYNFEKMSH
ncbi:lysostaphin resistance A-like protein [Fusibacter sp. JL216-2]|uniref:CPBP family intramembrane glutamic endopeptidase n=1 Tax=Fusibacter sp. JL216-2 TaxID=3071453 RepID=UPI003D3518D2